MKALALPLVPCQARAEAGKATSETKPFRCEVRSGKQPGDAQRNLSEGLALSAVFHRRLVLPSVGTSSVSHNSEDVSWLTADERRLHRWELVCRYVVRDFCLSVYNLDCFYCRETGETPAITTVIFTLNKQTNLWSRSYSLRCEAQPP